MPKPKKNQLPESAAEVAALRKLREQVGGALASMLKARRQDGDISQPQMGFALGATEDVIYNIEAHRTPISIEDAIAWWIISGTESPADRLEDFIESLRFALRKVLPRKPY